MTYPAQHDSLRIEATEGGILHRWPDGARHGHSHEEQSVPDESSSVGFVDKGLPRGSLKFFL
jgi:hypothetical protein